MAKIRIPYGKGSIGFSVPRAHILGVVQKKFVKKSHSSTAICNGLRLLDKKLSRFKNKSILIVVSDLTRYAHVKDILPVVLEKSGKVSKDIEIIVGSGLHKPHTEEELRLLLGKKVLYRYKVSSHLQDEDSLMDLGRTDNGIPRILSSRLKGKDIILSIGVIEPHLYAGYSGGAKTVAIGLAGEAVISATHSIRFLDDPSVKLGSVRHNAFQDTLWKIAADFIPNWIAINVVNDADGNLVKVLCGKVREVFNEGVRIARGIFAIEVAGQADVVICGIGYPKDVNLYQASRAINYILNVDRPIVRKGGVVIIAAELRDGMGAGITEKRFGEELRSMRLAEDFVKNIRKSGCIAGAHRAYMVAGTLKDYHIAFVNTAGGKFLANLPFPYFKNMKNAISYAKSIVGERPKLYVVPRALCAIAISGKSRAKGS